MFNQQTGKVEIEEKETKKLETYDYDDKLSFIAEWKSGIGDRHFIFHYFPFDKTIQLYDKDKNYLYLRRIKTKVRYIDLYPGNKLMIFGKLMTLTDFANVFTGNNISEMRSLCILKPVLKSMSYGKIISVLEQADLRISRMTRCRISRKESLKFYEYLRGRAICPFMVEHLVSGPSLGLEMVGHDAVSRLYAILGPRTPSEGRKVAPHTLRAIYGKDRVVNAIHGTVRKDLVVNELSIFFPPSHPPETTALYQDSTLCIIMPHIVLARKLGEIINCITESHFRVTALDSFHMNPYNTEEFLARYKGLVPDFHKFQEPFMNGTIVACEISGQVKDMDVFGEFKEFCGPRDPVVAREIRPNSLRAIYGIDRYDNAVYCSTVREDALLELEYFFKIVREST